MSNFTSSRVCTFPQLQAYALVDLGPLWSELMLELGVKDFVCQCLGNLNTSDFNSTFVAQGSCDHAGSGKVWGGGQDP